MKLSIIAFALLCAISARAYNYGAPVYQGGAGNVTTLQATSSVTAPSFWGNGVHLTGLSTAAYVLPNALPITTTISTANVAPGMNGASQLIQATAAGVYPALDGSLIQNLSTEAYTLPSNVMKSDAAQTMTSSMTNRSDGGILSVSSITASAFFGDASHLTGVAGAATVPASGVQSGWLGSGVMFSTANLASGVWQPAQLSTLLHGMTLDGTTLVSTITFTPSGANGTEPYSIQAVDGGGQDIALLSYASPWQAHVQPNGFGGLNPPMLLMAPKNLSFDELLSTTSDIGMGSLFFSPVDPELGAGTQYVQGISYVHSAAGNSWMNGASIGFYNVWATTTTELANIQLIAGTVDGSTYTAFSVVTDPFFGALAGLGTSIGGVWTPFSVDALIASGDIQLGGSINMQPGQGIWGGPTIDSVTVQNLATMRGGAIISGSLDGDYDGDSLDVINGLEVGVVGEAKALGVRTSGGGVDIESTGAALYISNWSGSQNTGTQQFYQVMDNNTHNLTAYGDWTWYTGNTLGMGDKVLSIQASTGFIGISSNTPNFPLDVQSIDGGSGIGVKSLGYIAQGPSPVIVYMCTDPGAVDDGQLFLGNGNTLACTAGSWTAVGIQLTAYPSH